MRLSLILLLLLLGVFLDCREICAESTVNKKNSAERFQKAPNDLVSGKVLHINQSNFGLWKAYLADGRACIKPGVVSGLHSPPYKQVYFANAENKTYMVWNTKEPYLMGGVYKGVGAECSRFKKSGKKKYLGYDCDLVNGYDRANRLRMRFYFIQMPEAAYSWRLGLAKTMYYPVSFGLPLRIDMCDKIGSSWLWRTVFKVEKIEEGEFKKALFQLPVGYKQVKSITALVFSEGGNLKKSDIEDLFEHHFKKSKKK